MYAAMPAVLKNAVEKSYSDCGWNLNTSKNKYGESIFPTFADVGQAIKVSNEINNISEWVHSVVDRLAPSIQEYSRKQIDLVVALILLEQSVRDTSYRDVLNKFTEIYKNEGGVF